MDLLRYLERVEFEHELAPEATDSIRTIIRGNRHGLEIKKLYDVEPILKEAAFIRKVNDGSNGFSDKRNLRHVGLLPAHVGIKIMRLSDGDPFEEDRLTRRWLKAHPGFQTVSKKGSF